MLIVYNVTREVMMVENKITKIINTCVKIHILRVLHCYKQGKSAYLIVVNEKYSYIILGQ